MLPVLLVILVAILLGSIFQLQLLFCCYQNEVIPPSAIMFNAISGIGQNTALDAADQRIVLSNYEGGKVGEATVSACLVNQPLMVCNRTVKLSLCLLCGPGMLYSETQHTLTTDWALLPSKLKFKPEG